jgi:5-methylcytosine-specific restriction endonuclease McrA
VSLLRRTPLRPRRPYNPPRRSDPIPPAVRAYVRARDDGCVLRTKIPHTCWGALEIDHVRASEGLGLKSRSTADNLVTLCSAAHQYKTEHGKEVRPILLAYLEAVEQ